MKKALFALCIAMFAAGKFASAEKAAGLATAPISDAVIVDRGAHHRTWQRVRDNVHPSGKITKGTNYIVELCSGLHYQENGQWIETEEAILPDFQKGGASAAHGPHKVWFAPNLNTADAFEIAMPDGQILRGHVAGLAYWDPASGKSALVAQVKDATGEIIQPNQVVYLKCFTDFAISVRYTYTKGGIEQDLILHEQIPPPGNWGLPETSILQVYTEFTQAPEPTQEIAPSAKSLDTNSPVKNAEPVLTFGSMGFGSGKAFSLDSGIALGVKDTGVPVQKSWEKIERRTFLIEAVPYGKVSNDLQTLPLKSAALSTKSKESLVAEATKPLQKRWMPPPPAMKRTSDHALAFAKSRDLKGYVIDYQLVSSDKTDFTFARNTNYLISGACRFFGTTTIEGGTVVKYVTTTPSSIELNNSVVNTAVCATDPYLPAVFTSRNDDTVGEIISAAGTPLRYDTAIRVPNGQKSLKNLQIRHANVAFNLGSGSTLALNHAQIAHCGTAFSMQDAESDIRNALVEDITTACFAGTGYTVDAGYLTLKDCPLLAADSGGPLASDVYLKNTLLANVPALGNEFSDREPNKHRRPERNRIRL